MTDDLLRKASQALREETDTAEDSARFTRSRVMASVHKSEVRRRTRLAFILPIAASFAAATAWGTVNGKTGAWIAEIGETLGFAAAPAAPPPPAVPKTKPAPRSTAPTPPAVPTRGEVAASEVAPPADSGPSNARPLSANAAPKPTRGATPLNASAKVANNPPPSVASAAPSASASLPDGAPTKLDISDHAHELYRAAHRRHFVEHDYAAALGAWDTYLREAPSGRFVLEARYNRALCLARLGRNAEARGALTPFAAGQFGGYRQREASALMDALP